MSEKYEKVDKVVTESVPSISKLILVENGRGGLKVKYNIAQTINGVMNNKKRQEEVNRAVQKEIREGFKLLKKHLLKAVGFYWPNEKIEAMLLSKCVVTTVVIDKKDHLQVSGYMIQNGTHHAAIASPFLAAEDYSEFVELEEIIDKICEESKLFMSGTKSADKIQIVKDYLTIKKDISDADEAYSKMTDAEISEITREALEDSGLKIIMEDGVECIGPAEEIAPNQNSMVIEDDEEYVDPVVDEIVEPEFQEAEAPKEEGSEEIFMEL